MKNFSDRTGRFAILMLAVFALLAGAFSIVVPPFESPDELYHYGFVQHVAAGNGLPVQSETSTGPWAQEGSQAPLYYLLAGAITAPIDQSDFGAIAVTNPHANIGDPLYPGNKNRMLYSGGPPLPLTGANLALHMGRWLSIALGLVTLACTFVTARMAFPGRPAAALAAVAIIAFLPQFDFIAGSLNNDNLVTAMAAAAVCWLARLVALPTTQTPTWRDWVILGVLLGLAALSKLQGLGLVALAGLAVLGMAWQRRDWRLPLHALVPTGLSILLIAGWWYWRNLQLYGDLFGLSNLLAINGRRQNPLTWDGFWREFRGLRYSFWGLFGWFNILLPQWIYRVLDGFTLIALAGLGWWQLGRVRRGEGLQLDRGADRVRLLLLGWAALSLLLLLYWTSRATGSQGRLIFPGLIAFAILLAGGLEAWLRHAPARLRGLGHALLPGVLLAATLLALTVLLPHAYRAPQPIATLPPAAQALDLRYGAAGELHLDGIALPDTRYRPGESVPISLYTRAETGLNDDYRLFIQLLDSERNVLGNVTSHPGWGRNPTTLWAPDTIYPDPYQVLVEEAIDVRSPQVATVYVGFIEPAGEASDAPLPATDGAGRPVTPFVGQIVIAPHRALSPADVDLPAAGAVFGDVIELAGAGTAEQATPGQTLRVRLLWQGLGRPAADYTAFVHLRTPDGRQAAGYDEAPAQGRFPTSYWQEGERVLSEFLLTLPDDLTPGAYEVWVGLYDAASAGAERLAVAAPDAQEAGADEVLIATVSIDREH